MSNDKITIEDLRPAEGATHRKKRVGRGRASGCGKTSSRGHNGEGQRSGRSAKRGFEGGQMPAYRRLPKLKGFELINRRVWAEINVGRLEELSITDISLETLKEIRKIHPSSESLRILGNGEVTKALNIKTAYISPSAKEKIEAAGGKVELV